MLWFVPSNVVNIYGTAELARHENTIVMFLGIS